MICNIFYKGDNIEYVRFAMTNPDRLIEFYGYMENLGQPSTGLSKKIYQTYSYGRIYLTGDGFLRYVEG